MENQHQHIRGYRDLTPEEIALMNAIKAKGEEVGELFAAIEHIQSGTIYKNEKNPALEKIVRDIQIAKRPEGEGPIILEARWLAIAKTELQKGFMFFVRAVARPTTF